MTTEEQQDLYQDCNEVFFDSEDDDENIFRELEQWQTGDCQLNF